MLRSKRQHNDAGIRFVDMRNVRARNRATYPLLGTRGES
jgi:hypothetical protein